VESAVIFWAFFTCPKNDLQKSRCFSGGYLSSTREKQVKRRYPPPKELLHFNWQQMTAEMQLCSNLVLFFKEYQVRILLDIP